MYTAARDDTTTDQTSLMSRCTQPPKEHETLREHAETDLRGGMVRWMAVSSMMGVVSHRLLLLRGRLGRHRSHRDVVGVHHALQGRGHLLHCKTDPHSVVSYNTHCAASKKLSGALDASSSKIWIHPHKLAKADETLYSARKTYLHLIEHDSHSDS